MAAGFTQGVGGSAQFILTAKVHCTCVKILFFHERTKHVDVRFYFVREVVNSGLIKPEKIPTEDNPADTETKVVPLGKFRHCLSLLHMLD